MHFLLLNQTFWPDVAATAQYLSQVALELRRQGHEVTVITSRRAYDSPDTSFAGKEEWEGVRIRRVWSTGFSKGAKWKRAANFATFLLSCCFRMLFVRRPDVVVALTSPPLISVLGACLARLRGCRFVYWVMDFNPDEAIAAGWLRAGSLAARYLEAISRFSLRHATRIIALDRFMADRIIAKGIDPANVAVIPPWSQDSEVAFDPAGRDQFRARHGLTDKFVVMYSGNHSPCHPLDTLLDAADRLAHRQDIVFLFVGGGSEFAKVKARAARHGQKSEIRGQKSEVRDETGNLKPEVRREPAREDLPSPQRYGKAGSRPTTALPPDSPTAELPDRLTETPKHRNTETPPHCPTAPPPDRPTAQPTSPTETQANGQRSEVGGQKSELHAPRSMLHARGSTLLCLPYQPLRELSGSLSAADLHVVVMGQPFVGLVHPCKIYNILSVAAPVLYIGPRPSHLTEILDTLEPTYLRGEAAHGEVDHLVQQIEWAAAQRGKIPRRVPAEFQARYSQAALLPPFIRAICEHGARSMELGARPVGR